MHRIFFTLLFTVSFFLSPAQQDEILRFEKIEGLSQNTGYSITKDKKGFLWIATANGLNRYDGVEMKAYKPALEGGKGQMKGRVIRSRLLVDGDRLWFSTDISLHCFDQKNESFVDYRLQERNVPVFANPLLMLDKHLWLANAADGIFDLNTVTQKTVHYPLGLKDEKGNPIQLMYHGAYDQKDRLWFASSKGLISFSLSTKQWQLYLAGRSFYSLAWCRDTLYISEGKNLIWFDPVSGKNGSCRFDPRNGKTRDLIHCVYADSHSTVWVGDEKGNVYSRRLGEKIFSWKGNINGPENRITNYPVYSFYADTTGMLWTGAYALGLLRAEANGHGFHSYPHRGQNHEQVYVNSIYEDPRGKVWLGTFENGILELDKKSGTTSPLQLPYKGPRLAYGLSVPLIQEDSRGAVWASMSGFLFIREKGKSGFLSVKMPPPSNALQVPQMWSFAEYANGWLVGTTVGLYHIKQIHGAYVATHLSHWGQERVANIWVSPAGEVWIAFESGGLAITANPLLPQQGKRMFVETNIRSFLYDTAHQLLWITSASGLVAWHLPTQTYKNFTSQQGLPTDYIYGVIQQGNELWISSDNGLSKAVLAFGAGPLPSISFVNFTTADGLIDQIFTVRGFHKGKSGDFYFGTARGLCWFRPGEISDRRTVPTLQMIGLLVNEKQADSLLAPGYISSLQLDHKQNNLFFRFRGIDYKSRGKLSYAYMLEGWDKDWIYSNQLNEVRYSHLPHGNYVFKVKAAGASGVWTKKSYNIAITIRPPFWRTGWFYTITAMAVLATAILVTRSLAQRKLRRQLRELEKQRAIEAERNRISKDMHDEIGSGLTHIALLSELMQTQNKAAEELKKDVGTISASARKLVESMSEIIWTLNPQNDTLENLLAYLREQTSNYFEPFDIRYSIRFPDELPEIKLTNEQRRNLFLVAKEALHNAFKHFGAATISLCMDYEEHTIRFLVSDDGRGFDAAKVKTASNGLKNMEKRMKEIGGQFEFLTNKNGTLVRFSLDLAGRKENLTTFFTSSNKH